MSWNPLKKLAKQPSRLSISLNDDALESCVPKLEQLDLDTRKLYKDSKKYEDCLLDMCKSEKKMTEDLSNSLLCQEEDRLRTLVEEWHSFACGLSKADEELVANLHYTLTDPVKKFHAMFPEVKLSLRKYEQCRQDSEKLQAKVAKLETKERTAPNLVKLDHAKHSLNVCVGNQQTMQKMLKQELPIFYDKRIEYFQPSIEAIIRSEVDHWGDVTTIFNDAVKLVPKNYNVQAMDDIQRKRLARIQALSIVAGS